jgi:hypothetical protein
MITVGLVKSNNRSSNYRKFHNYAFDSRAIISTSV